MKIRKSVLKDYKHQGGTLPVCPLLSLPQGLLSAAKAQLQTLERDDLHFWGRLYSWATKELHRGEGEEKAGG